MARPLSRFAAIAGASVVGIAIGTSPASAATYDWNTQGTPADVVGAHTWGSITVTSGADGKLHVQGQVKDTKADNHAATATIRQKFKISGNYQHHTGEDRTGANDSQYGSMSFSVFVSEVASVDVAECVLDVGCGNWTRIWPR